MKSNLKKNTFHGYGKKGILLGKPGKNWVFLNFARDRNFFKGAYLPKLLFESYLWLAMAWRSRRTRKWDGEKDARQEYSGTN